MERFLAVVVCVISATTGFSQPPEAKTAKTETPSIDAIRRAWTARQERFQTFDITFTSKDLLGANTLSGDGRFCVDSTNPAKVLIRLDTQGYQGKRHHVRGAEVISWLAVPDLANPPDDIRVFPQMHLSSLDDKPEPANSMAAAPLMAFFRPNGIGGYRPFDVTKLKLDKNTDKVIDRTCIVARVGDWQLWIDPEHDYVPVRGVYKPASLQTMVFDLSYRQDKELGFVPVGWKNEMVPFLNVEVRVTFLSTKIRDPKSAFKIDPPIGTLVTDFISDTQSIAMAMGRQVISREVANQYSKEQYLKIVEAESSGKK